MLIPSFRGESAYNAEYNSSTFPFTKQGIYVIQMLKQRNKFKSRQIFGTHHVHFHTG